MVGRFWYETQVQMINLRAWMDFWFSVRGADKIQDEDDERLGEKEACIVSGVIYTEYVRCDNGGGGMVGGEAGKAEREKERKNRGDMHPR